MATLTSPKLVAAVERLDPWRVLDERITHLAAQAHREVRLSAMMKKRAVNVCFSLAHVRCVHLLRKLESELRSR